MYYKLILSSLAVFVAAALLPPSPQASSAPKSAPLEVHEWGTFTSMQGVDGHSLEGMHHEQEELPAFVHRIATEKGEWRERPTKGGVNVTRVVEKMETPVIYFYSDVQRRLRVDVSYRNGLMSEWFPAARQQVRTSQVLDDSQLYDLTKVGGSSLWWDVNLTPAGHQPPAGIPAVSSADPWSFARQTKSAFVTDRKTGESDRYLFYRGLGGVTVPMQVKQLRGGDLIIKNETGGAVPAAFVLEVEGGVARWLTVGKVGKRRRAEIGGLKMAPKAQVATELRAAVEEALIASGLFRDEAVAMVKTWSRSWFESEGSRVIYIVPSETVNQMLPLRISPKPDRIVRTLVGRLEYVKPEVMKEVTVAVRNLYSLNETRSRFARHRIKRLGRYVEPHVRLLLKTEKDPATIANAERLLVELCPKPASSSFRTGL